MESNKEKTVLLVSNDSNVREVENVIDWLKFYNTKYFRINGDVIESKKDRITLTSLKMRLNNRIVKKDYYSLWFWRWSDFQSYDEIENKLISTKIDQGIISEFKNKLFSDNLRTRKFIMKSFKVKKVLTDNESGEINKLLVLKLAKELKIKHPKYLLTNSKSELIKFSNDFTDGVVCKAISDGFFCTGKDSAYISYVEHIDKKRIEGLPDYFGLSMFQELITKEFDIRAFFLNGVIYSMAIFSQADPQTKIDFRKYNYNSPNRTIPFKLPSGLERKLNLLMSTLNLKTGSFDIIKSKTGQFYFLEINPIGQFGMTSHPCNYNLEMKIAEYLTK